MLKQVKCPVCKGTGKESIFPRQCSGCNGYGYTLETEKKYPVVVAIEEKKDK